MSDAAPKVATPEEAFQRVRAGVQRFQAEVYASQAAEYRFAATHPQRPHTLAIACSDSRVNVEALMGAGPGEVFITRNIGNMVPAYGEDAGGLSAVVEYAVVALGVRQVVVCGHSDCGAMKALLDPASTAQLPAVRSWLAHGQAALHELTRAGDQDETEGPRRLRRLTERNVLQGVSNLATHPAVQAAMGRGELAVLGWVYDIGLGEVSVATHGARQFTPL